MVQLGRHQVGMGDNESLCKALEVLSSAHALAGELIAEEGSTSFEHHRELSHEADYLLARAHQGLGDLDLAVRILTTLVASQEALRKDTGAMSAIVTNAVYCDALGDSLVLAGRQQVPVCECM